MAVSNWMFGLDRRCLHCCRSSSSVAFFLTQSNGCQRLVRMADWHQRRRSSGVTLARALPKAASSVSRVRAAIRRRAVLSLENIRSIGFKSGLYGGRNSSRTPAAAHNALTRGEWCTFSTMHVQVVQHDHVPRRQFRQQNPFEKRHECRGVAGSVHQQAAARYSANDRRSSPIALISVVFW